MTNWKEKKDFTPAVRRRTADTLDGKAYSSAPYRANRAKLLAQKFYDRDPRIVARELLGKIMVRREGNHALAGRIVEAEAYLADDPAAHSFSGRTARNAVLFGPPGLCYVYFIYGNHFCANVSCLPDGVAGGVLFRALEPLEGIEYMAANRDLDIPPNAPPRLLKLITSGPGRLAEALAITRTRDNEKPFYSRRSDLQIVDDGWRPERIAETPRIGVSKAAEHPYRYVIAGNPFVSGRTVKR